MKKICLIGAFCFKEMEKTTGGQPVKTRELYYALLERYAGTDVMYIDTYRWRYCFLRILYQLVKAAKKGDIVIMLPASNGLVVFSVILAFLKRYGNKKIYYDVIGGWLPDFLKSRRRIKKKLQFFDGIWVETKTMKEALENAGFENVSIIPNFKRITVLKPNELVYQKAEPYRLCTFSRVIREKGIDDAVEAVKAVNKQYNRTVFTLDIYGPVGESQKDWFDEMLKNLPDYIKYIGIISPEKSVNTLKNYFALLFPTRFYTEGIPGTIIDAYAAGVPVISSIWESYADVVDDKVTGFGYEFNDLDGLKNLLISIAEHPDEITSLKTNCLQKAEMYTSENVIDFLVEKYLEK